MHCIIASTRITLALAGDSLDDANFERLTADAMILRLSIELDWMQAMTAAASGGTGELRPASDPRTYWDVVFSNRMQECVAITAAKFKAYVFVCPCIVAANARQ